MTASSRRSNDCRTPERVAHRRQRAGAGCGGNFFLTQVNGHRFAAGAVAFHASTATLSPHAFECGSACQPETAYARSRTPLTNANEPHRPPPAPGHASGDPRPRVGRFRLACRTAFERISGDSVAVEARNATTPAAYLRGNSWRTRPAHFPPSPQSPSAPGAPLTLDRKSFQRILPRHVALGARHAPASGSYLTASMRRSLCAPQLELRPTRRGTKPKCRIPNPNPNPRIEGTPHTLCHVHATTLPSVTEETLLVRATSKRSLARSLARSLK